MHRDAVNAGRGKEHVNATGLHRTRLPASAHPASRFATPSHPVSRPTQSFFPFYRRVHLVHACVPAVEPLPRSLRLRTHVSARARPGTGTRTLPHRHASRTCRAQLLEPSAEHRCTCARYAHAPTTSTRRLHADALEALTTGSRGPTASQLAFARCGLDAVAAHQSLSTCARAPGQAQTSATCVRTRGFAIAAFPSALLPEPRARNLALKWSTLKPQ